MNLSKYYTASADDGFVFTREQGSHFAKDIAGDFNPLHDADAKKFCIPGDLLFSLSLAKLGVSQKMQFTFSGMVTEGVAINFADSNADNISVTDVNDKEYMSIERSGEICQNSEFANNLAQRYVEFSGHTFPHILVPLMKQQNAMINPARPLVIYQSMSIELDRLDFSTPSLEITDPRLEVEGKRGRAILQFCFKVDGEIVGKGEKIMLLSGLRAFDSEIIGQVVVDYDQWKQAYVNP
ncbi:MAG: hypothetical protein OFPI_25310 [Osedax symbiont Rs2]|nr:MAG: hypothetical protein OFPI_25310 [Osedax symbiont Rs2]